MTTTPRIILNNLSFHLHQTPVRFDKINLSFESLKYGIVGANGIGKTTFLRLLIGDLIPDSGSVQRSGTIINVPQMHLAIDRNATIRDALGVSPIFQALERINKGSVDENDFGQVADYWDIEQRFADALSVFNLWPIKLCQLFHQLSGGQKTKLLLAKTLLFPADFLLFDEPTNNLDRGTRDILYRYIENSAQAMLIVSHDRALLNKCDRIISITAKGIAIYGGNYDFYKEKKAIESRALAQEIQTRTEILVKSKQAIQTRIERHQQNESRGRKQKKTQIKGKGSYNKIELKSKKGRSEGTNRHIRLQAERKLKTIIKELSDACAKREMQKDLNINLEKTSVPNNKTVLHIKNLSFRYDTQNCLIDDFSLMVTGPNRIAITGPNGCGKSTLMRLIRGLLAPHAGKIIVGVDRMAYLDQAVSFLNSNESLVENFLKLNPHAKPFDAYSVLAAFRFRNNNAEKQVKFLSGGERIRAGLAISLMSSPAPQLLILDEPTNHLDLAAIAAVEEALNCYQGAILAVSHDEKFLKNIGIKNKIVLLGSA